MTPINTTVISRKQNFCLEVLCLVIKKLSKTLKWEVIATESGNTWLLHLCNVVRDCNFNQCQVHKHRARYCSFSAFHTREKAVDFRSISTA